MCAFKQDTSEEIQERSTPEAYPAFVAVADNPKRPTNEYVLNVAFLSFLLFTTVQLFFALIARSDSMMADCAAMYVDVVTYLFNFLAERLKHAHDSNISARALHLRRLYLELIPPSISVVTLLIVTVLALQQAFKRLFARHDGGDDDNYQAPDLGIMLAFSALNLVLDGFNVSCFASVDQTAGFIGGHHTHSSQHDSVLVDQTTVATETTPLFESSSLTLPPMDIHGSSDNSDGGVGNDAYELDSQDSSETPGGINLNMCSAFTHIAADTLRSIAVLLASGFASLFPSLLSAGDADSYGAILVSGIILVSLGPLVQGLYLTARKIHNLRHSSDLHHGVSSSKGLVLGLTV